VSCVRKPPTGRDANAAQTADTLRRALANDDSNGVPFTQLYTDVTVTVLDGPQHIVRAEATAAAPKTMLYAFDSYSFPGQVGQGAADRAGRQACRDASCTMVTSDGAPTRTGGPQAPAPRVTYSWVSP
jgi:hypothetical protein